MTLRPQLSAVNLVISVASRVKLHEKYYISNGARSRIMRWYKVKRADNVITVTGEHEGNYSSGSKVIRPCGLKQSLREAQS